MLMSLRTWFALVSSRRPKDFSRTPQTGMFVMSNLKMETRPLFVSVLRRPKLRCPNAAHKQ